MSSGIAAQYIATNAQVGPGVSLAVNFDVGTVADGGTIPEMTGYAHVYYFVSPCSSGGAVGTGSGTGCGIQCSVNQATRVVDSGIYNPGGNRYSVTANYLAIGWN